MPSPATAPQPGPTEFVAPFILFLAFLILPDLFAVRNPELPWWRHAPELWIYPLQTLACLALLAYFWKRYSFRPFRGFILATCLGLAGFAIWIAPSSLAGPLGIAPGAPGLWTWLGFDLRTGGFDPTHFEEDSFAFLFTLAMRLIRMVICVPLIEEIFWRGFLMRIAADPHLPFHRTPFGTHSWRAFTVTTVAFVAVHHHVDFIAAAVFGSLVYFVAVRTQSLAACILMHAVANLALGSYIITTRQWGFW